MSALDTQVGGEHYKDMVIQPVEFIQKNRIGFVEGNIIKYICRWRAKNGLEDLHKVKHYIDLLIDIESSEAVRTPSEFDLYNRDGTKGCINEASSAAWDAARRENPKK